MNADIAAETSQQQGRATEVREGKKPWISEEEWSRHIQDNSDDDPPSAAVCIFRVPEFLKELKREAYVPKIVSLGPCHHTSAELPPVNSHKGKAVLRMTERFNKTRANDPNVVSFSVRAREEIGKLEKEIRNSYEEKIDCDGKTLALMLSFDGCFILEMLRSLRDKELSSAGEFYRNEGIFDAKFYRNEGIFDAKRIYFTGFDYLNDILKLENQIPLVVLRKLLQIELSSNDAVEKELLPVLVKDPKFYPFNYFLGERSRPEKNQENVHHLLGLLHNLIVSSPGDDGEVSIDSSGPDGAALRNVRRIPRAAELRYAGIKFKPCVGGIMMINFDRKRNTIYLPPLNITGHTEVLFSNLIAFEICNGSEIKYVTNYVSFMDELINSEEDVALLRKMGIVTNWLGSDVKVAELFNGLYNGVTPGLGDYFNPLKLQIIEYYNINLYLMEFHELVKKYFTVALTGGSRRWCSRPCKPSSQYSQYISNTITAPLSEYRAPVASSYLCFPNEYKSIR